MVRPLTWIGRVKAEASPTDIFGSNCRSRSRLRRCSPKASTVWSDGMRTIFGNDIKSGGDEKIVVGQTLRLAIDHQRQLARMVVAPHRGFAARNFAARRSVIPAVRTVIDRV